MESRFRVDRPKKDGSLSLSIRTSIKPRQGCGGRFTANSIIAAALISLIILRAFQTFRSIELFDLTNYLSENQNQQQEKQQLFARSWNEYDAPLDTTNRKSSGAFRNSSSSDTNTTTNPSLDSKPSQQIRKWGCHRTETPLIFVHIGKAGGGEIRMRLAGAAQNYTRGKRWGYGEDDHHFYPIAPAAKDSSAQAPPRRGKFCNSKYANNKAIFPNNRTRVFSSTLGSFEGVKYCNATTPLGMAIACPLQGKSKRYIRPFKYVSAFCDECDDDYYLEPLYYHKRGEPKTTEALNKLMDPPPAEHTCDTVYVSHNFLGGELNWLPPRYLKEHWWDHSQWSHLRDNDNDDHKKDHYQLEFEYLWASLLTDRTRRRNSVVMKLLDRHEEIQSFASRNNITHDNYHESHGPRWCPKGYAKDKRDVIRYDRPEERFGPKDNLAEGHQLYHHCMQPTAERADGAFREFWKEITERQGGITSNNYSPIYASLPLHRAVMLRDPFSYMVSKFFWDHKNAMAFKCDNIDFPAPENPSMNWIEYHSYAFLFNLCGYDCHTRWENHLIDLEDIEAQVSDNLRQAFSVVGLLEDVDTFYNMLHKRIDYLDLNKPIDIPFGQRHITRHRDKPRCEDLFLRDETFREQLRSSNRAFAAFERVYNIGVEVNRFQKEELKSCE